jgi:prephenate dehydrogenase
VSHSIKIVGTGLLGTSLGLALARHGITAGLVNQSKANLRLAIEYGAGEVFQGDPELVIVCVPPDITAEKVIEQLELHPGAIVTDVASVKADIAAEVAARSEHSELYVGSHPMAGREKGGVGSARADLFFARPWVITPTEHTPQVAVNRIRDLALQLGALPSVMTPDEHDKAVAAVSHLPQLLASALAASLTDVAQSEINLAGQGLRDTARIAASDPGLWVQILSQNASNVAPLIGDLATELNELHSSLSDIEASGALAKIHSLLERGNDGVARIPGKHGGKFVDYHQMTVVIDDSPGALASLLTFIGDVGVNIEDLKLEHSPGAQIGLVEIQVLPSAAEHLSEQLTTNGWRLV